MKDAGVASELRADILGHGGDNITEERYVSSAKLKQMLEALEKLPIVTGQIGSTEICLRRDILQKRSASVGSSQKARAGDGVIIVLGWGWSPTRLSSLSLSLSLSLSARNILIY